MLIRDFREGDEAGLRKVFLSAVHESASRDYTVQQLNAWAPRILDEDLWNQRMRRTKPYVVEIAGRIVAFADLHDSGFIDHFFVSAPVEGQGIGSALMRHLHDAAAQRGIRQLSSDVSRTAQAFFEHFGFEVVEQRVRMVRGVSVPNAFMTKSLNAS